MSLTTPESVQKLQRVLHDKAKEAPNFRFYAVYDKVYRKDVLSYAYEGCHANGGAAGVDNQTFEDIEQYGAERWLEELTQELKSRTYQPQPVRRVSIPKPDGKQRPLGIPTIRDRVVQTAAGLVLEPIFEADLPREQYAYRADRSALDAVQHVHKLINTGHGQTVDADLSSYFDSIPHAELMKSVARRVVDGAMLHLIESEANSENCPHCIYFTCYRGLWTHTNQKFQVPAHAIRQHRLYGKRPRPRLFGNSDATNSCRW